MTERAERLLVDALTACGADATPRELRLVAAALESTSEQDLAAELAVASQVEGGAARKRLFDILDRRGAPGCSFALLDVLVVIGSSVTTPTAP